MEGIGKWKTKIAMGTDRFTLMADMNIVLRKVRWDEISNWKSENMGV